MRLASPLYSAPSVSLSSASTRGRAICIHPPAEDLCSGARSWGSSQIHPPAEAWLHALSWTRLPLATQRPKSAPEPPPVLWRSLFPFQQPHFLRPIAAPPQHPQGPAGAKWGLEAGRARGLAACLLLAFQGINSRTIEPELFVSIALNITRESLRTIGLGSREKWRISGFQQLATAALLVSGLGWEKGDLGASGPGGVAGRKPWLAPKCLLRWHCWALRKILSFEWG